MSGTVILSFTDKGFSLAEMLARKLFSETAAVRIGGEYSATLKECVGQAFASRKAIIFIGAAGIAVRSIAPFIASKASDPPVIVIDEAGRYVIPILSGHIGGANQLARDIASIIGGACVITTATDTNGVFSVDCFASENGYAIINTDGIKHVSAAILKGDFVGVCSDFYINGSPPKGITKADGGKTGIYIGHNTQKEPFDETLILVPKRLHIGIGARKNICADVLLGFLLETLKSISAPIEAVAGISSIDLKKDEKAILAISQKYHLPYTTYSAEELNSVSHMFAQSPFVKDTTGTGNVCEAAAYLSSGKGVMLLPKTTKNGAAVAIAMEDFCVTF